MTGLQNILANKRLGLVTGGSGSGSDWRTDIEPDWNADGYTRQPENEPGEYRQKDYATGLTMEQAVRKKK